MRFTLAQLRKLRMPYHFTEELDLSDELNDFEDIISVENCIVNGEIRERGIDTYMIKFEIISDLIMRCAVTLEEVPYRIETIAEEVFSNDETLEDAFPIEGQTVDTKEAVLTNILIAKPMTIVAEGVEFESDEDYEEEVEEEKINPAFASLKDLL